MSTYSQRPKTPAGRIAWAAFAKAMGREPAEISYGHGAQYGWAWTAEDGRGNIWVYTASWSKAHCAYAKPVIDGLSAHRAGDEIDRLFARRESPHQPTPGCHCIQCAKS